MGPAFWRVSEAFVGRTSRVLVGSQGDCQVEAEQIKRPGQEALTAVVDQLLTVHPRFAVFDAPATPVLRSLPDM